MFLILIIFALLLHRTVSIPIDNGIESEPSIHCGHDFLTVEFSTENDFEGHIFVKGLFSERSCGIEGTGHRSPSISLAFGTCNVARTRSLNPTGVFVSVTVVVSFHPLFVTKIDRAYRIQCFYMPAEKPVTEQFPVSEITPPPFDPSIPPMPACRYEILEEGPTGDKVQYASIGDKVYHKWTCDTDREDTFCIVVYSCYVDDGRGDRVELLDADGCAIDKHLVNNLEYLTDTMAGVEAHVFKYADRAQLYFQCQISVTVKPPNSNCPRPNCDQLNRRRRQLTSNRARGVADVRTELSSIQPLSQDFDRRTQNGISNRQQEVCVNTWIFLAHVVAATLVLIVAVGIVLTKWRP